MAIKKVVELTPQQQFANNLRAVATWYEKHPKAPIPSQQVYFNIYNFTATAEEIRAIGTSKKEYADTLFKIVVDTPEFILRFIAYRDDVCTKKVIDVKHVEAKIIPGYVIEPELIPAHDEEICVWECPGAILAEKVK